MKLNLFVLAITIGIVAPVLAQTNPPTVSGARIAFAAADYDFGKVDSGTAVKHEYFFTNTGNEVLEITAVRPGCGCTTAGDWDKKVEPGKTGKIPVQFNSTGYGGQVHKSITVTCNDSNTPNVTLNLSGTIWKAFDVSPAYAIFNLRPEGQGDQTSVVKIINNTDQPATVSDPACGNPAFKMELKPVQEGKEYELRVTAIVSNISGNISAPITMKTSSPRMPQVSVTAFVMIQPQFSVNPTQIVLPAGPLTKATDLTVTIQNNSTNPVTLSEAMVNTNGVNTRLVERQSGRLYELTVNFPAGFQSMPGVQATVRSSSPKNPLITIPVHQPQPPAPAPASAPAAVPTTTPAKTSASPNTSAAARPVPVLPAAMASGK
jgi:hypothetical protein